MRNVEEQATEITEKAKAARDEADVLLEKADQTIRAADFSAGRSWQPRGDKA